MEAFALQVAAPAIDPIRSGAGLPPDPGGERLRQTPYLTVCPASLEDPDGPVLPATHRFSDPAWDEPAASDRWAGGDAPFVYATFGSVAGGLPMAGAAFGAAMEALGELPVRGLLTVGHVTDRDSLPAPPANVEVEAWVPRRRRWRTRTR